MSRPSGCTLIIIGGHEDKKGERLILKEVVHCVGKGRLALITVATEHPEETAAEYRRVLADLGLFHMDVVDIRSREESSQPDNVQKIMDAAGIFFTGGDQLRITSQLGGTAALSAIQTKFESGAVVIGTSAGAAAMPKAMLVSGAGDETPERSDVVMAAGLGLLDEVIIDSHFAQRGRIGRLLSAVARNPQSMGLGLDEDTALVVRKGEPAQVVGSGALYVVDGARISYSSVASAEPGSVVSLHDVRLHVLGSGQRFDLDRRIPLAS